MKSVVPFVPFLFALTLTTGAPLFGQAAGSAPAATTTAASDGSSEAVPGTSGTEGAGAPAVGPARPGVSNPHGKGGASAELFQGVKDQPTGKATLVGKLSNKSAGDANLGGVEVRLFAFGEKERKGEWRADSADDGSFHFSNLSTDPTLKYIVSALFQGVVYLSDASSYAAGIDKLTTEIQVYDSAPAPGPAKIDSMHVIVQADPASGGMQVTEVIAFDNPGDKTLIGGENNTLTLQLDMPASASNVQVMQGLLPAQVFVQDKALVYTGPLYPGVNQAVITYQIAPTSSWIFRRRVPFDTDTIDVFVTQNGPAVLSPQLQQKETVTLQGTTFNRYGGGPLQAGGGITFEVGGVQAAGAGTPSNVPAAPLATVIGLGALIFVAWPLTRMGKTAGVPLSTANPRQARILELIRERDLQMASVKEIDDDYENGKLSEEDYQRLRERHKALAIQAMKGLAELGVAENLEAPEAIGQTLDGQARSAPGVGQRENEGQLAANGANPPPVESAGGSASGLTSGSASGLTSGVTREAPADSVRMLSTDGSASAHTGGVPRDTAADSSPVPASEKPAAPLKFCTACGTPTVPGDKFCGGCGVRLRGLDG